MAPRILITAVGAICAAGRDPDQIRQSINAGKTAAAPIPGWGDSEAAAPVAARIADFDARFLVPDRKSHKLLRRSDMLGLYAASRAIETSGVVAARDALSAAQRDLFNDRSAVYAASGGSAYQNQYDFFPLMTEAADDLRRFGKELAGTVNPMWLLQNLPNNVLCHLGIRWGFKGPNTCIVNVSAGGPLALIEAASTLASGEADRAVAVAHDAPIEPQVIAYFRALGLLSASPPRPFDRAHDGTVLGEGAAAMMLETEDSARAHGATPIGELLGSGCTSEAQGVLPLRADGDGLARAIAVALADAGLAAHEVGMIVAHGNGTPNSDASEAKALRRMFGAALPPVTSFKWCAGHLMAASGMLDAVLAIECLRSGEVPGIATFTEPAPECAGLPLSSSRQAPRSDIALVLSRALGGISTALLMRALPVAG